MVINKNNFPFAQSESTSISIKSIHLPIKVDDPFVVNSSIENLEFPSIDVYVYPSAVQPTS